jgi:hypothetical protein
LTLHQIRRAREAALAKLHDWLNEYPPNACAISTTGQPLCGPATTARLHAREITNNNTIEANQSTSNSMEVIEEFAEEEEATPVPCDAWAEALEARTLTHVQWAVQCRLRRFECLHEFRPVNFALLGRWFLANYGSALRPILESRHSIVHPDLVNLVESMDEETVCLQFNFFLFVNFWIFY